MNILAGRIDRVVASTITTLNVKLGTNCPKPSMAWDLHDDERMGAAYGARLIRLNPAYAIVLGQDYEEIAMHEACHVVTVWRRGPSLRDERTWGAHGNEWRRAMRSIGLKPRTHYCIRRAEAKEIAWMNVEFAKLAA